MNIYHEGSSVRFYACNRQLDEKDAVFCSNIQVQITPRTKAVYWVHDRTTKEVVSPFFPNEKGIREWWRENTEKVGPWKNRGEVYQNSLAVVKV